ncbi:MAG: MMPL family transporter [Methanobacteriota archaeon]
MASARASRGVDIRLALVGLVLLNAGLSFFINRFLGTLLVSDFTIDWYHHQPHVEVEEAMALGDAFVTGFLSALVVGLIVGYLTVLGASKGHYKRMKEPMFVADEPTTFGLFAVKWGLGQAVLWGIVSFLNALAFFVIADVDEIRASEFILLKAGLAAAVASVVTVIVAIAAVSNHQEGMVVRSDPERGNVIARLSLVSARRAGTTVLVVLLITAGFAGGLTKITTNVDVADVLPRGDANTTAAKNLTARFKSAFTQQVTLQVRVNDAVCEEDSARKLPLRRTTMNCGNITDEVYVRALDEMYQYVNAQSSIEYNIATPTFYKLANWTRAGGYRQAPDAAFGIPGTDRAGEAEYQLAHEVVWRTIIAQSVVAAIDPTREQGASLFLVTAKEANESKVIGEQVIAARDEYLRWAARTPGAYKVFTCPELADPDVDIETCAARPYFTVDNTIANAHAAELTKEDIRTLMPFILYFIVICLYVAFRNLKNVFIALSVLFLASIWTYGAMGYAGIALNTLNLTIIPLLLGVGIDYGLHMVNEYQEHRSEGKTDDQAFKIAGDRAGKALLISTLTTIAGLLVMTLSPSLLIAQLGALAALGMAASWLLAVSFIPAAIAITGSSKKAPSGFSPSGVMGRLGHGVHRTRYVWAIVLVAATFVALANTQNLREEAFGDPGSNFPEDDIFRIEHEEGLRGFYDSPIESYKTNVIVFQGDVMTPEALRYIRQVSLELAKEENVNPQTLRDLPFLLETWLTVKGGATGAGTFIAGQNVERSPLGPVFGQAGQDLDNYPETNEEIVREFNQIFASPLATFGSLFVDNPDYNITITVVAVRTGDYDTAAASWEQVWTAIGRADPMRPAGVEPTFVGNTALNYLFIKKELPWLGYMAYAASAAVVLLVAGMTRSVRATLSVGTVMFLTSFWWLGLLPELGVGLAITLALPMIFILSSGSDYAVHLACNIERVGAAAKVFRTTGKAVIFSWLTTAGAFLLFSPTQNVAVSRSMIATFWAFNIIFACTVLVVPLFYRFRKQDAGRGERDADAEPIVTIVSK